MIKVLHFSPVRKDPEILDLHLQSLVSLEDTELNVDYTFFDDNVNRASSDLLKQFIKERKNAHLLNFDLDQLENYVGKERWTPNLYRRITYIKNRVINFFLEHNYDYLFLTDSDLILNPYTLKHLVSEEKDFCASIFWTNFKSSITYTPNAWYAKPKGFSVKDLFQFREKGIYPVDFTGACTLLSRRILADGVSFEKIRNISSLGEDKHFCIRAAVFGYQPYVSTFYPSYHVYDKSYLDEGKRYISSGFDNSYLIDWLDAKWEEEVKEMFEPSSSALSVLKRFFQKLR